MAWRRPACVQMLLAHFGIDAPLDWTMQMNSWPLQAFHLLSGTFQLFAGVNVLFVGDRYIEGICIMCNFVVRVVHVLLVRRVHDYKKEAVAHLILSLVVHAITSYSCAFSHDDIYRHRGLTMNFMFWKVFPSWFVFPRRMSYLFMLLSGFTDVFALILADSMHGTTTPLRVYGTLALISIFSLPVLELSRERFRMLYDTQQQLIAEKLLLQKMLAMLCEGTITLGLSADMIMSSNKGFDHLMGRSMEGEALMKYIPDSEKDHEHERVRQALGRAQSGPVLIPTTFTSSVMGAQNVELFIVHQAPMNESKDPTKQIRYLVGIRRVSQEGRGTDYDFHIDEPVEWHADAPNNEKERRQRHRTLQEKLLLCAAEFEQEGILDGNRHTELKSLENGECNAKSVVSAPAVVQQPAHFFPVDQLVCSGTSCLPTIAEVWKEGHSVPTSVQAVVAGDRVLCRDEWTGSVCYAPVTRVHITDAQQTSWVMVTLEDGSMQQMTSDHPVYPYAHGQPCLCSRACDLTPGYHMLPVLKLTHVPVKAVEHVEVDTTSAHIDMNSRKASLSVIDNRRYTVLACCGAQQGSQSCMAVGAVEPPGKKDVMCRNTFLHVVTEEHGLLRRCSSEPALYPSRMPPKTSGMQCDSAASSALSSGSASIVMWDQDVCKASFVVSLKSKNQPSVGSNLHESTHCRPCMFQARRHDKKWAPCWKGAFCEYCHVDAVHTKRPYTKKRL